MITPALSAAIEALIAQRLAAGSGANEQPRCLEIHSTHTLYEYYLAPDGTVYEVDLDRTPRYERVESAEKARETYVHAAARFPTLAALAQIDPASAPQTFEAALAFPGHVVVAWDDTDPTGRTLVACSVSVGGAKRLASRTIAPHERDALFDALGRDQPLGATLGPFVWNVELISDFNLYDATTRCTSYVKAWDVARIRSARSVELIAPTGAVTRVVDDTEPAIASRLARDFANWLGCPHHDNGTVHANARELELVRACRELARRNVEPTYAVPLELRVSAGDVAVSIVDASVCLEHAGRVVPLRTPAPDSWRRTRQNTYLEYPWIIRDIVRVLGEA